MADETKTAPTSTEKGSSQSPISPQIKLPSSPSSSDTSFKIQDGIRPLPPSGGPAIRPPIRKNFSSPLPSQTPPAPKPLSSSLPPEKSDKTPPMTMAPSVSSFGSSIRTMQDDLSALKKGEMPAGSKMEKQSGMDVPEERKGPVITPPPPRPQFKAELGASEKAKPFIGERQREKLEITPSPPKIPSVMMDGVQKAEELEIPQKPSPTSFIIKLRNNPKAQLIAIIASLVVIAALVWVFVLHPFSETESIVTFSPTFTPRLSPTPTPLEDIFSLKESLAIEVAPDIFAKIETAVDSVKLLSGAPVFVSIVNEQGGGDYNFGGFTNAAQIPVSYEILLAVEEENFGASVMRKLDGKNSYGLVVEVNDTGSLAGYLINWETSMTGDLHGAFGFDPLLAASPGFLNNAYQGVAIRYKNFPDANSTIDRAVVKAKNGKDYLVITSSREHIYAIIDEML